MTTKRKRHTMAQLKWMRDYKRQTGFEPTLGTDEQYFEDFMWTNLRWFEQWAKDVHARLCQNMPQEASDD